ncbi:DUF397 domain-containing protein [Yinghuangia sp. KLBMP8922]|uniref:DUF397 domain-containing protein n=1 Tax=Yinghuangia soli TaxID=2908204 RepID=A0AA41PX03_9ACTN|nr:DUF397 domain-containing protein [Yinghuangia soli]MCF2526746.1 DUF397 domain-containing protein [Yinghuangia soli]
MEPRRDTLPGWRKSSYSGDTGCVEVAAGTATVGVRDSKSADSPVIAVGREEWGTLLDAVRHR